MGTKRMGFGEISKIAVPRDAVMGAVQTDLS